MNPNHKPFACAIPAGTTPFVWLIAGPQKAATNDPKFKTATIANHGAAALDPKCNTEVTQPQKEK